MNINLTNIETRKTVRQIIARSAVPQTIVSKVINPARTGENHITVGICGISVYWTLSIEI